MIIWDGILNLRSFRVKTGPECSFARFTRNRVARAREIGFPKFKMHNLAFWDLKDSKVNSRFEFGVVSSLNDKVTAILRFSRKRRNSRERNQDASKLNTKATYSYQKWHFWPFMHYYALCHQRIRILTLAMHYCRLNEGRNGWEVICSL